MKYFQKPNKALVVAIVSFVIYAVSSGVFQPAALVVFAISLTVWGWEDIKSGESVFRKILGYVAIGSLAALLFAILNSKFL